MSQNYPLPAPKCRKLSSTEPPEQTFLQTFFMALCAPNW